MDIMTGSATVAFYGVYILRPTGGYVYVVIPVSTVESNVFAAGGHYWSARFVCHATYDGYPRLWMDLHLWSTGVKVKASLELSVIDPLRRVAPTTLYSALPQYFVSSEHKGWHLDSAFVKDQCCWYVDDHGQLMLQITVTVVPDDDAETTIGKQIDVDDVPPSNMLDQLGEVLRTREGVDVTFSVDGELFPAHKIVLAMRSRVFKAQLYEEMKETGAQPIEVSDMTANTFRALLRYIYTDTLPASSSNQQDEEVWEVLTAADRYSVERLKLICECVLCKRLDVDNVAKMLGLADRHHCGTLKDACIKFMTTSERIGQVMKSQGFLELKHSNPLLSVEVLEKSIASLNIATKTM